MHSLAKGKWNTQNKELGVGCYRDRIYNMRWSHSSAHGGWELTMIGGTWNPSKRNRGHSTIFRDSLIATLSLKQKNVIGWDLQVHGSKVQNSSPEPNQLDFGQSVLTLGPNYVKNLKNAYWPSLGSQVTQTREHLQS